MVPAPGMSSNHSTRHTLHSPQVRRTQAAPRFGHRNSEQQPISDRSHDVCRMSPIQKFECVAVVPVADNTEDQISVQYYG